MTPSFPTRTSPKLHFCVSCQERTHHSGIGLFSESLRSTTTSRPGKSLMEMQPQTGDKIRNVRSRLIGPPPHDLVQDPIVAAASDDRATRRTQSSSGYSRQDDGLSGSVKLYFTRSSQTCRTRASSSGAISYQVPENRFASVVLLSKPTIAVPVRRTRLSPPSLCRRRSRLIAAR